MIIFKFKILLLGAAAVGKTSVLHRFVNNEFKKDYQATIGITFLTKNVKIGLNDVKDDQVQLNIWDIAGHQKFVDLRTTFYRGSNGALLIFDLTREKTFEEINAWHSELTKVLESDIPFVLIGNKSDLIKQKKGKIDPNEAKKFTKTRNSIYMETSAKTGKNIENAFLELTRLIAAKEEGLIIAEKKVKKAPVKAIGESYIIKSKVREYIKSKGCNTSGALINGKELNRIITELLDKAIERAKNNLRKTVKPIDL